MDLETLSDHYGELEKRKSSMVGRVETTYQYLFDYEYLSVRLSQITTSRGGEVAKRLSMEEGE